ncbi:hypothetical protein BDB01DRAFT_813103 [Pilobolus umbonatus]|nr:hypothetical protein BDB01DRAFT_813103 [Pilobolus umbonatus]
MNYSSLLPVSKSNLYAGLERYGSAHLQENILGIEVFKLSTSKQNAFVRKVMAITTIQLLVTLLLILFFSHIYPLLFPEPTNSQWYLPYVFLGVVGIVYLWQLWIYYFQLSKTHHLIYLSIFSISTSIVLSNLLSTYFYKSSSLIILLIMTGLFCCFLYTFQAKRSFSGFFPFVTCIGSLCFHSAWLRFLFGLDPIEVLIPVMIACLVCCYIITDLYYIMQNVTSDDYIYANIFFFIDFIYPIRFVHHFCELTDTVDTFPDILYPGPVELSR